MVLIAAATAAWADISPRWSDDQLARFSTAIVSGRVVDITTGRDPQTNAIYTYVTLAVDEVLKGAIEEREITIKQLGGQIGDEGLGVSGQAAFGPGEDVLVFLETRPRDGTLYTSALWQGKWTLQRDAVTGERVAVRAEPYGSDRGALAGVSERRALQSFTARLRAVSQGADARSFVVRPSEAETRAASHPTGTGGAGYALFSPPWRWNEFDSSATIPLDVMSSGQPGLSGGGGGELTRAVGVWGGATGLKFGGGVNTSRCFGAGTADRRISIVYMDPCGEVDDDGGTLAIGGTSYTSSGGTTVSGTAFRRAVAGYIVNNDSASALRFLQNSGCFASVHTHELGHVLGLDHSADTTAIMYFALSFSRCSSSPIPASADDLAGIRSIYPGLTTTSTGAPGAPTGFTAASTGSTVNLAWSVPTTGGTPTAYTIEAGSASGGSNLANFSTNSTATTFSAPGVGSGVYYLRVKATNSAGTSAASNEATLVVGGACTAAPGAPTGFTLTGNSGGTVSFAWTTSSGSPTSYVIEAGSAPGSSNLANSDLGSTATSYTATGVGAGTYYVRLRAKNTCGTSGVSNEVVLVAP